MRKRIECGAEDLEGVAGAAGLETVERRIRNCSPAVRIEVYVREVTRTDASLVDPLGRETQARDSGLGMRSAEWSRMMRASNGSSVNCSELVFGESHSFARSDSVFGSAELLKR